jgi:hypothetical protein
MQRLGSRFHAKRDAKKLQEALNVLATEDCHWALFFTRFAECTSIGCKEIGITKETVGRGCVLYWVRLRDV